MGLTSLGLRSAQNLGLLLHLLGLKVPGGALTGLDDVLIGLTFAAISGGTLQALTGSDADRGCALDRQRVGRGFE
jgi:hypothetical protein